MPNIRIIIVGFMGCGKSALGKSLAKLIDIPFIDTDDYIVEQEGKTITHIFETLGEPYFRQLETNTIQTLFEYPSVIIATGGGMPCFANNMELLNKLGTTIYLEASAITLRLKLQNAYNSRPLISDKSPDELLKYIQQTLKTRQKYYNQAKIKFPAHSALPQIMAQNIIELLKIK